MFNRTFIVVCLLTIMGCQSSAPGSSEEKTEGLAAQGLKSTSSSLTQHGWLLVAIQSMDDSVYKPRVMPSIPLLLHLTTRPWCKRIAIEAAAPGPPKAHHEVSLAPLL